MAKAKLSTGAGLLDALKFVSVAGKDDNMFGVVHNNHVVKETTLFAVGMPVQSELDLCPHVDMMVAALRQCKQGYQLVQLDSHNISIKSGIFRAVIPALHIDEKLSGMCEPDPILGTITVELVNALVACKDVPNPSNDKLMNKGILLQSNTVAATNGGMLMEIWHGVGLPAAFIIPTPTVEALAKIAIKPTGFGCSAGSFTFWFDGGAFLKTKLIDGQFPGYERLFVTNAEVKPLWPGFFEALDAIEKFVVMDTVHFQENELRSHNLGQNEVGASMTVEGLPAGHKFSMKFWQQVRPFVHSVAIDQVGKPVILNGNIARVAIVGKY